MRTSPVWLLYLALILASCMASASPISFTGNVGVDFDGKPGVISQPDSVGDAEGPQGGITDEPLGANAFTLPPPVPIPPSGFNVERVVAIYDCSTDTFYVGIDIADGKIPWDADGDGNALTKTPDILATPESVLKEVFSDVGVETYDMYLDYGADGRNDVMLFVQSPDGGTTITTNVSPSIPGVTVETPVIGEDLEFAIHGLRSAFPTFGLHAPVRITTLSGAFYDLSNEEITSALFDLPCPSQISITTGVSCSPNGPFTPSVQALRGAPVYFQVSVTNCGADNLRNVVITDASTSNGAVCPGGNCMPNTIDVGDLAVGETKTFVYEAPTDPAFSVLGTVCDCTNTASVVGVGSISGITASGGPVSASVDVLVPSIMCEVLLDDDSEFGADPMDSTPPASYLDIPGGQVWYRFCVTNNGETLVDFTQQDGDCPGFHDSLLSSLDPSIPGTGVDLGAIFRAQLETEYGIVLPPGARVCAIAGPITLDGSVLCPTRSTLTSEFFACGRGRFGDCLPLGDEEMVSTGICQATVRLCSTPTCMSVSKGVSCSPDGPFMPSITVLRGTTFHSRLRITNCGTEPITNINIQNGCFGNGACVLDPIYWPMVIDDLPPGASREYSFPVRTDPNINTPGISVDCICVTTVTARGALSGTEISYGPMTTTVDLLVPDPAIGAIKAMADGEMVSLEGKLVTVGNDVFSDCFYIEDEDRSSGIKVVWPGTLLSAGDVVSIEGSLATDAFGERCLDATWVETADCPATAPKPLGMTGGMLGVKGLNNIGLMVRTWGTVTHQSSGYFYLDDGSKCDDGSGHIGVKVLGAVPAPDPLQTDWPIGVRTQVTGISSCFSSAGNVYRLVRATDVTIID